ncbi:hypothetical protein B0H19DRAFT_1256342 [Mycena capillaripes]|nr:hypothetical protein B0H19DRAFT_1256342 [Mycena capillaripes]
MFRYCSLLRCPRSKTSNAASVRRSFDGVQLVLRWEGDDNVLSPDSPSSCLPSTPSPSPSSSHLSPPLSPRALHSPLPICDPRTYCRTSSKNTTNTHRCDGVCVRMVEAVQAEKEPGVFGREEHGHAALLILWYSICSYAPQTHTSSPTFLPPHAIRILCTPPSRSRASTSARSVTHRPSNFEDASTASVSSTTPDDLPPLVLPSLSHLTRATFALALDAAPPSTCDLHDRHFWRRSFALHRGRRSAIHACTTLSTCASPSALSARPRSTAHSRRSPLLRIAEARRRVCVVCRAHTAVWRCTACRMPHALIQPACVTLPHPQLAHSPLTHW